MIAKNTSLEFSQDEQEILQEVMNVSFGQVAADLAEIINVLVILSVPKVTLLLGKDFPKYLKEKLSLSPPFDVVEQSFSGKLNGVAFLVFPAGSGKTLVTMFDEYKETPNGEEMTRLEKETMTEIGNILTGACVGKLAEQLKEVAYYSEPRVAMSSTPSWEIPGKLIDPDSIVILVKTEFKFESNDTNGFLFLITNQESFGWLKKALNRYIEQF